MSKLYCVYSNGKDLADHKCDSCGRLLCKICGYSKDGVDYCNECWEAKEKSVKIKMTKEIAEEVVAQGRDKGWAYAELFLQSKGFNFQEIGRIQDRLRMGKSLYPYKESDTK